MHLVFFNANQYYNEVPWVWFQTPLLVAVARGVPQMVTLLLEAGADVNATDIQQNSAFHLLAKREGSSASSINVMTALIQMRPNLSTYNLDGKFSNKLCFAIIVLQNTVKAI